MGVWREGKAIARIIVSADCVLVDMGGLDDGGRFGIEAVAGEGAGEIVTAEDIALEAGVAAFLLAGFEFVGIQLHGLDGVGIWNRQAESGAEHDLLLWREVNGDESCPGFAAEGGILEAVEEIGIKGAEAGGDLGSGRLPIGGETLPDFILIATECVEGHGDVGLVALAFEHEFPVIAEAGDEADIVFHPSIRNVAGFDQVDDSEQQQWFVWRDAARTGSSRVKVGKFAEPVGGGSLQGIRVQESGGSEVGRQWQIGKSLRMPFRNEFAGGSGLLEDALQRCRWPSGKRLSRRDVAWMRKGLFHEVMMGISCGSPR